MDRREYHTEEIFGTAAYSFGGRVSGTISNLITGSVGFGSPDISVGIGIGLYWKDSREEIEKLTKSAGFSVDINGVSVGVDVLAEPVENRGMLGDFLNAKGVRFYVGKGFIPLKVEVHTSFLDYGKPISEAKNGQYKNTK